MPVPVSSESEDSWITPIQTESPRSTLQSLFLLRDDLESAIGTYWQTQNNWNAAQIVFNAGQLASLIDLSQLPLASRTETGSTTALYLLDILGRVKPIAVIALPGTDELTEGETSGHRLPGTPLRIVRVEEGDRAGEFLFAADTIRSAPRFYEGLKASPLRS
ncbi:unnamed protein product, partial [Ectocarpus sp. 12 AP-2014]